LAAARQWRQRGSETAGVIGHGILAGKYLAEYRDSLK
jgi:hypothetical protein